jgi:hypothetical protein
MGKKEDSSSKSDVSSDDMAKDLEDVDDDATVDEIPDEVLLNEPLDDDDLINDLDGITTGKKPRKPQKKQQTTRKTVTVQQSATLEDLEVEDDLLSEMESILSGKTSSRPSSKSKAKSSIGRVIQKSIYIQVIHAMLFLELCLVVGFYIPHTLLIVENIEKYVFLVLHSLIGVIIIGGGILFFRFPRIAVLLTFLGTFWIGLAWIPLYFSIGLSLTYGWWVFPLLCIVTSGILVYFTIHCVLHDPSFAK